LREKFGATRRRGGAGEGGCVFNEKKKRGRRERTALLGKGGKERRFDLEKGKKATTG